MGCCNDNDQTNKDKCKGDHTCGQGCCQDKNDYYTCSMHPEIHEDEPGKCPKCGGMDLVLKSSE
ncbi:MAG: hypothetical protein COY80_05375 [Candidatus Pacebacteria bacterium CG_4_10_14_0_8_um_filter_42_14]|nr:MAG: hypothetical protein COY80_05375 [Candidatus Pacebacteria bacterium CG_4_10_14_0_8_um_filter_42_14]